MIGRPDLCAAAGIADCDADGPDRQTQRPCYNCVTRLVIGGPARICSVTFIALLTSRSRNNRARFASHLDRPS